MRTGHILLLFGPTHCVTPIIIRILKPANVFVMVFVKHLWTMGGFLPIWNKIQNLETVSGSFRPLVVSVLSFRPESFRPICLTLRPS